MYPKTLRERRLVDLGNRLLTEAIRLDNTAKTNAEAVCDCSFADSRDPKRMVCRPDGGGTGNNRYLGPVSGSDDKKFRDALEDMAGQWSSGLKLGGGRGGKNERQYVQLVRLTKMNNADIGTFTEYFAGEYLLQRLQGDGWTDVELRAQGAHNAEAGNNKYGTIDQTDGKGRGMFVIKKAFYRRVQKAKSGSNNYAKVGYTRNVLETYRTYGFQQGELAYQSMLETLNGTKGQQYKTSGEPIIIYLVGSSSSNVNSPGLLGQEDMQIQFAGANPPIGTAGAGNKDNMFVFSNKSGGSNPRQVNKTASSVGLCTPDDITAALARLKPRILSDSIDLFLELNEGKTAAWNESGDEIECYQYLYKSALGNRDGGTRGDAADYDDADFSSPDAIKTTLEGVLSGILDRKSKAFKPPSGDKAGAMKKSGSQTFISYSTCVTTILGQMAASIAETCMALNNIATSDQIWDMIVLGSNITSKNPTSILATMYPSVYENLVEMHTGYAMGDSPQPAVMNDDGTEKTPATQGTQIPQHWNGGNKIQYTRQQLAEAAFDAINGTSGRYFSVNEKNDTAENMAEVHSGFMGMLECTKDGKAGNFEMMSSEEAGKGAGNNAYFVYKCEGVGHIFMSLTLRKNSGSDYNLGGTTLNNLDELVAAVDADDSTPDVTDGMEAVVNDLALTGQLTDGGLDASTAEGDGQDIGDGQPVDVGGTPPENGAQSDAESFGSLVDDALEDSAADQASKLDAAEQELQRIRDMIGGAITGAAEALTSGGADKAWYRKKANAVIQGVSNKDASSSAKSLQAFFDEGTARIQAAEDPDAERLAFAHELKKVTDAYGHSLPDGVQQYLANNPILEGRFMNHTRILRKYFSREGLNALFESDVKSNQSGYEALAEIGIDGAVIKDAVSALKAYFADEGEPEETVDPETGDVNESRWLKLAGLLKD